ncbi:MAG: ribose-phosphate diphosphokinase [Phycisphaerae bacterium]|nr:ribose-phosphate diphosphokinase [Phycisphaerae bacterium]
MDRKDHHDLRVFAGSASPILTSEICRLLHIEAGRCEVKRFSEGNTFVRVLENVRGRDTYVVQTLSGAVNDQFMELLFWIDALRRASAKEVTAVIPFFSYAKGDKKDEPRVSIRARVCADCIEATGADRVLTMDLHAPQIQGFFGISVDHLYALPVFVEYFRPMVTQDWMVVAPDVGFGEQARRFGRALGIEYVVSEKTRTGHNEQAEVLRIIGDVQGKTCVIVDDFATSGGTLVATAHKLLEEGATEVFASVSHGLLPGEAPARIQASPIKQLVITDTIEGRTGQLPKNIKVVSVAPLFARAIHNIHHRTSISELFES